VVDFFTVYRDIKESQYVKFPAVFTDEDGSYTVSYTGLLFYDFKKEYIEGEKTGQEFDLTKDEGWAHWDIAEELWGYLDWNRDFVPGILQPKPIPVPVQPSGLTAADKDVPDA
jgi:hypothetical protein